MNQQERPAIVNYGIALLAVAVATLLRLWLHPLLEDGGFALHLAAIVVVAWMGGLGPCLVAQVLTLVVSGIFFGKSPDEPPDSPVRVIIGLAAFFFVGIAVAVLSASVRSAQRRAWETEQSLREADRRKDVFLAVLAHELRNPLAPIGNGLQILSMAGDDATLRDEARLVMQRQFEHLVRLVDDLLDVSRIARGKIELRTEPVALDTVVERAVEATRPLIDDCEHRLRVECSPEPLWLQADPVRVAQVVSNLLTNAARYTDPGGEIVLTTANEQGRAVIRVRDSGIGIAPKALPKVFDMFMQAEQGLDRGHAGLGLGLTLVKSLVQMHGGEVEARSEGLGKGSEFVVRLRLIAAPELNRALPAARSAVAHAPRRILVVDDNADAADSLARLLKLKQHDVYVAHSGRDALQIGQEFHPDIAILDLGMPGVDGFDVAQQLRVAANGKAITLVALTGWGGADDRQRTRAAGFDHHFVKPITAEDLEVICRGVPSSLESRL